MSEHFTARHRIPDRALFGIDTLEARTLRAEAEWKALYERTHLLECVLSAVDQALTDERVPLTENGDLTEATLTRAGRIRYLGDRRRVAERRFEQTKRELRRLREEFVSPRGALRVTTVVQTEDGPVQMTVDDCIAEVENDTPMLTSQRMSAKIDLGSGAERDA